MIYFDNSATTAVDPDVLQTYIKASQNFWGNSSSLHQLGNKAQALLTQSRRQIAKLLNKKEQEIIFTSGGTEGNNLIIKGVSFQQANQGKHILVSSIEHPSVLEPAKFLQSIGYDVELIPVTKTGYIDLESLKSKIRKDTILISVMAVNNEIGTIQPIEEIAKLLQNYPTISLHVDAVQAFGKIPVAKYLPERVDFATFSGHKFHAPKGIGFVYAKNNKKLKSLLSGGGQERNFRSGTEDVASIASMSKAVRKTLENYSSSQLQQMTDKLKKELSKFPKVHIYTPLENVAPHIVAFGIKGIRGEVLLHALEEYDIYVSTTSACSSNKDIKAGTLRAMSIPSEQRETVIRISLSYLNTIAEVDTFLKVFSEIYHNRFKDII